MKLTPRLLYLIWGDLAASGLFFDNPDAPTEAAFRAHYAAPGAPPVLAWRHRRRDLKYLYDAEINQVQVTPALAPFTRQVEEANARLWRSIPPDLLEVQGDWGPAWFQAAREAHALKLSLILDQGWDVNAHDAQGRTALSYVVVPQEGRRPALQVLVEGGADLSAGGDPMASLLERLWEGVDRNPEDRSWEDRDWLDRTPLGYAGGLTHFLEVLVRERTAAGVGLDGTSPPGLAEASPDPFALRPVKSVELRAGMTYREAQEAVAAVWPALLLEVLSRHRELLPRGARARYRLLGAAGGGLTANAFLLRGPPLRLPPSCCTATPPLPCSAICFTTRLAWSRKFPPRMPSRRVS